MGDYGLFESDEATQAEPRLAARTAARQLEAAIAATRRDFGRFLLGATGIDEFEDRWHLSKNDIRKTVEEHIFPNTGTMRRVQNAMKADWKLAHPYKLAGGPDLSNDSGAAASLRGHDDKERNRFTIQRIPGEQFNGQTPSRAIVNHDSSELMSADGNHHWASRHHAEDRNAPVQDLDETFTPSGGNLIPSGDFHGYQDSVDQGGPAKVQRDFTPGGDSGSDRHEAARLVADIYTDFARANGLRVASLDTLDRYAATGLHEADYRLLQNLIVAACECDDKDDDADGDDSEASSASESDESDSGDTEGEAPDFGGESESEGNDEGSEDDESDSDDSDSDDGEDYDFGDDTGDDDPGMGDTGGGQQYTVPEHAPELDPQLQGEIPTDDPGGSAPVPPEVIDSLLGLPEGTIEQLLLEEVEQGAQGGTPQGGGDDFFGGDGDEQEPPRVAHRRQAGGAFSESVERDYERPRTDRELDDVAQAIAGPGARKKPRDISMAEFWAERDRQRNAARQFWAADDEQSSESDSGSGESEGGGGQQAPAQDPAAMGSDPNAMMGQPTLPPPGSQAVQTPAPPQQLENQPAEDALLDTANQAIMQMIDQETAEYQQIIAPLSQALQAVQMAQQVEQTEHPMDVTPPQGTVDVSPSAAPGGSGNPQQQLARLVRHAKTIRTLKNAARLIAKTYGVNAGMLVEAMGRRNYEHVAEAFAILPPAARQTPEVRAAANHVGKMFAAENPMFNHDVWMRTVLASNPRDRAGDAWRDGRDRGAAEHGRHDLDDYDDFLGEAFSPGGNRRHRPGGFDPHDHDEWVDAEGWDDTRRAARGRHPFDRARTAGSRQAGETWKSTPTMDRFEFPNEQPEITDNMAINDLPTQAFKGLPKPRKSGARRTSEDLGSKVQRWLQRQQRDGLNTGGDPMAEKYLQTHKVGPRGQRIVHDAVGAPEHPYVQEPPNPQADPAKAVNPVTKKGTWGEWEPTRQASFFTRRVPGWSWDSYLNGYLSKEGKAFTCACGEQIPAPSYRNCRCGKIWNITAIGDTHHLASDTADFYVAREVPVRPGVVMANKKLADMYVGDLPVSQAQELEGHMTEILKRIHPTKARILQQDLNDLRDHIADQDTGEGEVLDDAPDGADHDGPLLLGSRAEKSHRELLAEIERLADWTKYDSPDPINEMGKSGPPSTTVPKPPKDWAKRTPAGDPGKKGGTWTPPSIPRKKK